MTNGRPAAPKRVAILQSNYIPWRGYFDIIASVDEFVIYDIAQFTKDDWRNRNIIRTAQGNRWLTIPVITAGRSGQSIAETLTATTSWAEKHWLTLSQSYARAPFFGTFRDRLSARYAECGTLRSLSAINRLLIESVANELGLSTSFVDAASYAPSGDRNERLIGICCAAGASVYVSGPSARNYLAVDRFAEAGIHVEFMDYSRYAPYPQVHGGFESAVSVLDLLFNVGPDARLHLRGGMNGPWL